MAVDANGAALVSSFCVLRKVAPDGSSVTIAGMTPVVRNGSYFANCGRTGDGGPAVEARLRDGSAVAIDHAGSVFFAETSNHCVRRIDAAGVITTFAGRCGARDRGFSGDNGPALDALLDLPQGVATDVAGNVYIADTQNMRIRKVSPEGVITTVAGNGADFVKRNRNGPIP
jgi:hypothetical protein